MSLPQFAANDLVLVTGASGFIASWVVAYALQRGARVRGTVRDPKNETKVKHLTSLPGAKDRLELVALDLISSTPEQFALAVQGCTHVAHTASPFPSSAPKDENDLIKPAVEGTLGVLRACLKSPTVRSVVVTSSVAALSAEVENDDEYVLGEKDWTDVNTAAAYPKSKTLAERAAWDFVKEHEPSFSLCTVNPAFVLGPALSAELAGTSTDATLRLLSGKLPMVPHISFGCVDVRNVAQAHIQALCLPAAVAKGRRFVLCHNTYWFVDMANALRPTFEPLGYRIPSREAPYFLLWLMSWVDSSVAMLLSSVGKFSRFDSLPSREVLGITYTDFNKTMADAGHALVYHGLLFKTDKYKLPESEWTPLTS